MHLEQLRGHVVSGAGPVGEELTLGGRGRGRALSLQGLQGGLQGLLLAARQGQGAQPAGTAGGLEDLLGGLQRPPWTLSAPR